MNVRHLLNRTNRIVSFVAPGAPLGAVIKQLEDDEVAAVIVSRDRKTIEGIISTRSIARALRQYGVMAFARRARDFMTKDVVTCDVNESLTKIHELMNEHQVRHIPITENGVLCGIVNTLDIVEYHLDEKSIETEALRDYVTGGRWDVGVERLAGTR